MERTRTRATALVAAVAAAVTAAVVVQPGADAATAPDPAPDPGLVWQISRGGEGIAMSRQCTGLGSRSEVVEYRDGGDPDRVRKSAGRTFATDVTCSLALSSDQRVYAWRQQVENGDTDARGNVAISLHDSSGAPVQRWQLSNAWPSQYLVAFDRAVVTLTHEGAVLLP